MFFPYLVYILNKLKIKKQVMIKSNVLLRIIKFITNYKNY